MFRPSIRRSQSSSLSDEEAESLVPRHIRSLPEEVWFVILDILTCDHLYDVASSVERARTAFHSVVEELPAASVSAMLGIVLSKRLSKKDGF